jgi:hypothetical protein
VYASSSKSFCSRKIDISLCVEFNANVERAFRVDGFGGTIGGPGIEDWSEASVGFGGTGGGMIGFRGESRRFDVEWENGFCEIWPRRVNAATSKAELADLAFDLELVSTYKMQPACWLRVRPWSADTGARPRLAKVARISRSVLQK